MATPEIPTTDPCGNPLPIPITNPTDFAFSLPSLGDLLNLLGVHIPKVEMSTPCPRALDAAKSASGV